MEMEATLKMHDWCTKYSDTIRDIGVSDNDLKALRKFGDSRRVSLQRACHQWEQADETLKMLNEYDDVWGGRGKRSLGWMPCNLEEMLERYGKALSNRWID